MLHVCGLECAFANLTVCLWITLYPSTNPCEAVEEILVRSNKHANTGGSEERIKEKKQRAI